MKDIFSKSEHARTVLCGSNADSTKRLSSSSSVHVQILVNQPTGINQQGISGSLHAIVLAVVLVLPSGFFEMLQLESLDTVHSSSRNKWAFGFHHNELNRRHSNRCAEIGLAWRERSALYLQVRPYIGLGLGLYNTFFYPRVYTGMLTSTSD